jgi:hypothetical protein
MIQNKPITMTTHCEYDEYAAEVQKVRDCVEGSAKVKSKNELYLPHPSQIDVSSEEAKRRYWEYKEGAEFDDQPKDTLQTLVGKMRVQDSTIKLPERVSYLEGDSDGDGMSLVAAVEYAASNVIQAKFHVVIADYRGLSEVDLESVSLADAEEMQTRASIKHYTRENVVNWHFSRRNGRMQLTWICLLERGSEFDENTRCAEEVQSYLILALDENGDYYQQKIVSGGTSQGEEGERNYVKIGGKPLKFIPLEIITDTELPSGAMPKGEGFLARICNVALAKYRKSAQKDEFERALSPTLMTKGWQRGDDELFKELNQGRSFVATGGNQVNNLPAGVEYDVLSVEGAVQPFQWSLEYADKKIISMGGTAKQEQANMTATEADINASEQNAKLTSIADNLEAAFKRLVNYCLMFEGGISMDAVSDTDSFIIELPRDFATPKLSVEEVAKLIEIKMLGEMTSEAFRLALQKGGWPEMGDADGMDEQPPVNRVSIVPDVDQLPSGK